VLKDSWEAAYPSLVDDDAYMHPSSQISTRS
jgi:hypothetical protein